MAEAIDTVRDKGTPENLGFVARTGRFIKETREELSRVSFPSRDDVQSTTLIVILNVMFFAAFLFVVDLLWVQILGGIEWLVGRAGGF